MNFVGTGFLYYLYPVSPLTIYKASAGSGKTYTLTLQYLRLLFLHPGRHRHILAVTFTNKAAGEMKLRILSWLYRLSGLQPGETLKELTDLVKETGKGREEIIKRSGTLLKTILNDYSYFSVGTIDRFFQTVIRAFTREIGIQPGYNLELDTDHVLGVAVDNMFMKLRDNPELLEWLIRYAEERIEDAVNWNFREDIIRLGNQLFREEFQALHIYGQPGMAGKESLAGYRRKIDKIEKEKHDHIISVSMEALEEIGKNGYSLADFSGGTRSVAGFFSTASGNPLVELSESRLKAIHDTSKWLRKDSPPGLEELVESTLQPRLREIYHAQVIANTCQLIRKNLYTLGILKDISESINEYTRERNLFLLNDAGRFLKGIIANNPSPFIFEKVGNRYDHIMLDEFQDTSLFQWENFKPLIDNSLSKGEDNLVVGDIKQSIYRWRNSDWRILSTDVMKDFSHQELYSRTLSINYRSLENIVRFNNTLFQILPGIIREQLESEFEEPGLLADGAREWIDIFGKAYEDVVQKIPAREDKRGGYVECRALASENVSGFYEKALELLPGQIEQLESAGYLPRDIAILVRKQDEGSMVAGKLLAYARESGSGYDFRLVSNESLTLSANRSIRLIIGLLRYIMFPNDPLNRAELKYLYHLHHRGKHTLQTVFDDLTPMEEFLPGNFISRIPSLKKMPLYELIEQIISVLGLDERAEDVAYIQALQNLVLDYQRREPVSIYSFLHYWEEKGYKKSITVSEETDAIRIMTIHKSKGLQFKAVIVPFCNWEVTTGSNKGNILWCDTADTLFEGIPLVPVKFGSKLKQSVFASRYAEETAKGYMDNLNLLYVSFTRARNALFIGVPLSEGDRLKNVGDMVLKAFSIQPVKEPLVQDWSGPAADGRFTCGELEKIERSQEAEAGWNFDRYPVFIRNEKLHVKLQSQTYFMDSEGKCDSKIGFGNIMHRIYSGINTVENVEGAVNRIVREGLIGGGQAAKIAGIIRSSLTRPEVAKWFGKDLKVINERDIFMAGGEIYRPDRVIIGKDFTGVIDFKFGDIKKNSYNEQVRMYVKLLREMGYANVTGYVWYLMLNEIITVD